MSTSRRVHLPLAWLVAAALVLVGLSAPGSASTATSSSGRSSAAAPAADLAGASTARPKHGKHRSCRAKKRHRTKVVTAHHGAKAGKRAGRKAFRRCKKAVRAAQTSPLTTGTTPGSTPGTTAGTSGGAGTDGVVTTDACLASVPDPGTTEPVTICYTLFQPRGADAAHPVPMIMHSHGFGGSRTTDPAAFAAFLGAGYGVLSFDQRGFGESGGKAQIENPDYEGFDVRALIDVIAGLDWVQQDGPGDPLLGAIGGSYGGGYQFLGAFESLRLGGDPIFDALAPEITWNDLEESLAPSGVVRTAWAAALSAAAAPSDALPMPVITGLAEGVATGRFPDSLKPFFAKNGPQFHTSAGRVLDIPVLFGQGTTDTLFPLEQGLQNFQTAITPAARAKSIFVGYNGGHVLPAVYPMGVDVTSDPCSMQLAGGTFETLSLRFFDEQLKGLDTGLQGYGAYHLATPDSTCLDVDSVEATTDVTLDDTIASPTAAGPAVATEILAGPLTLAGTPHLTGLVSSVGVDNRVFLGLAVGTSPADAHLVQNNVLPLEERTTVVGAQRTIALPSVAVEVKQGEQLYLLTSATDTIFPGMGSRTPGAITIDDPVVSLPKVTP